MQHPIHNRKIHNTDVIALLGGIEVLQTKHIHHLMMHHLRD